jgi:hypothetical protein
MCVIYMKQHIQSFKQISVGQLDKAKLQSVGVFLHLPLIVRLTYGTLGTVYRGGGFTAP